MDHRRVAELHDPHRKSGGTGYLVRDNQEKVVWFWVGSHAEYDKILAKK